MIPLWGPIVILVVAVLSSLLDDWGARRSLRGWARQERYELLEVRRACPWQAPYMYLRGSRLITWRVTVRAQSEPHSRTGLVTFMFGFLGGLSPKYVEVTWDTEQVDD